LKESVRLTPGFAPAWLALGKAYFANQDYELAADAFGHLPRNDANALQADFYRGLAFFYTGVYAKSEDAFAYVALRLPLPEVVNNQGVAASRHGKDAAPLFEQAIASDPRDPDYHFNLAISLRRRNDTAGAQREIDQALKLRPQDSEAQSFANTLQSDAQRTAARVNTVYNPTNNDEHQPLERIKRNYNEASFQQAAFEMEQMQAMRLATMTPAARAEKLTTDGTLFLNRGLILEAEREFQLALQASPNSAASHAGLAQVRERSADPDAARQEAGKSLDLQPNVTAHLVLARLNLQSNQLSAAASEVAAALKLEPANSAARGLRQALESRGQQLP
jgi:tetratricopeptide (TPR) repeat protein